MCDKCGGRGYTYTGAPCKCKDGSRAKKSIAQKLNHQHSTESWKRRENEGRNFDYGFNTNPKIKYRSS